MKPEVEEALKKLKVPKAYGIEKVTLEMILATGGAGVDIIHRVCQSIWQKFKRPDD